MPTYTFRMESTESFINESGSKQTYASVAVFLLVSRSQTFRLTAEGLEYMAAFIDHEVV